MNVLTKQNVQTLATKTGVGLSRNMWNVTCVFFKFTTDTRILKMLWVLFGFVGKVLKRESLYSVARWLTITVAWMFSARRWT